MAICCMYVDQSISVSVKKTVNSAVWQKLMAPVCDFFCYAIVVANLRVVQRERGGGGRESTLGRAKHVHGILSMMTPHSAASATSRRGVSHRVCDGLQATSSACLMSDDMVICCFLGVGSRGKGQFSTSDIAGLMRDHVFLEMLEVSRYNHYATSNKKVFQAVYTRTRG